jgi:hypothetical protein
MLNPVDVSHRFLGHLLLEVRVNDTFQYHSSLIHHTKQLVAFQVGATFDGSVDSLRGNRIHDWHEIGSLVREKSSSAYQDI